MANEDSVLREVDQELAEDRQWTLFRRYGPAAIGASLALVVGVGAWQGYQGAQTRAAYENALAFSEALETLEENPIDGRAALEEIAETGSSGYAMLAQFQRGASLARDGNVEAAADAYQSVYEKSAAPSSLQQLARLRAAYLTLETNGETAVTHLGDLAGGASPFRFHANEVIGVAALQSENYDRAIAVFDRVALDVEAPVSISSRAKEFAALARAGKAGVNITGEVRLDDIIGAVGTGEVTPIETETVTDTETGDAITGEGNASEGTDEEPVADDAANDEPVDETAAEESGNE